MAIPTSTNRDDEQIKKTVEECKYLYGVGYSFYSQRLYEKAEVFFRVIYDTMPEEVKYIKALAMSYEKLNKYDEAIELCQKIKNLNESDPDAISIETRCKLFKQANSV